ncbi:UDP-N-acetylenolpyruvoylglucosamine reductase [candidate division KSB1 bacterium]|nr:MAG: UDP-N-acetylenolpyruvoylglucosamine reductase [candidate division KSB1 bacterium]
MSSEDPKLKKLKQVVKGKILIDELLREHTSFKIGGPADYYIFPKDLEDLSNLTSLCQQDGIPVFVIGNGTNLLVSDDGFRGVVVDISRTFRHIKTKETQVTAGAGVSLSGLISFCTIRGFSGLEPLAGIPGQIGGCIALNAGAFGREIGDLIEYVRILDKFHTLEKKTKDELNFGYRTTNLPKGSIVVEAVFNLADGNPKEMERAQNSYIKKRKSTQPLSLPSAGSVFKRPQGDYAGRLIEDAGCKGLRIGDAMVSKKHANFIVNVGVARAIDVARLIDEVRNTVFKRFGVTLEPEIRFLGFNL